MTKVARVTNISFGIPCYRDTSPYVKMLLTNHGIGNKGGSLDSEKRLAILLKGKRRTLINESVNSITGNLLTSIQFVFLQTAELDIL